MKTYKTILKIVLSSFLQQVSFCSYAQIITTIAGDSVVGYSGDGGLAIAARLNNPSSVACDTKGNLYISDVKNNRVRKIDTGGIITTIAGVGTSTITGTGGFSGDGGPATAAELYWPAGLAFDAAANLYIADWNNTRIRKVDMSTGIISTVVGNGNPTFSGDGSPATAAGIYRPIGLTFDAAGNMYIADYSNNRVRMVNTAGIISTIAGGGNCGTNYWCGDGGFATNAKLNEPSSVALDAAGNIYIADSNNGRVRKIDASGIINNFAGAGNCGSGFCGDGGPATNAVFYYVSDVVFDPAGNLYITDLNNSRVRMVNTLGIITTVVGGGTNDLGDGGLATNAILDRPQGMCFDAAGNLYIADSGHNRIRKVSNMAQVGIKQVTSNRKQVAIYPNPASNVIQITGNNAQVKEIEIYDVLGNGLFLSTLEEIKGGEIMSIDISHLTNGIYIVNLKTAEGNTIVKFIKN